MKTDVKTAQPLYGKGAVELKRKNFGRKTPRLYLCTPLKETPRWSIG